VNPTLSDILHLHSSTISSEGISGHTSWLLSLSLSLSLSLLVRGAHRVLDCRGAKAATSPLAPLAHCTSSHLRRILTRSFTLTPLHLCATDAAGLLDTGVMAVVRTVAVCDDAALREAALAVFATLAAANPLTHVRHLPRPYLV
jgi:hypothetical protein